MHSRALKSQELFCDKNCLKKKLNKEHISLLNLSFVFVLKVIRSGIFYSKQLYHQLIASLDEPLYSNMSASENAVNNSR